MITPVKLILGVNWWRSVFKMETTFFCRLAARSPLSARPSLLALASPSSVLTWVDREVIEAICLKYRLCSSSRSWGSYTCHPTLSHAMHTS